VPEPLVGDLLRERRELRRSATGELCFSAAGDRLRERRLGGGERRGDDLRRSSEARAGRGGVRERRGDLPGGALRGEAGGERPLAVPERCLGEGDRELRLGDDDDDEELEELSLSLLDEDEDDEEDSSALSRGQVNIQSGERSVLPLLPSLFANLFLPFL
jgi:hypothetical protein